MTSIPSELIIFFIVLFAIWLVVLSAFLFRVAKHYQGLTKGIAKKDLKTILEHILQKLGENGEALAKNKTEIEKLRAENNFNIQKVGLIRYNPFAETGGDQSFCLSLLDGADTGLVISSLHSRETTRLYAKPVKNGKPDGYELSKEEQSAIKEARKVNKA